MDIGRLILSPDTPVSAGEFGTYNFEYTAGQKGLQAGDTMEIVLFTRFSTNLWSMPQIHDPSAPGFVTTHRSDNGFVHTEVNRIPSVLKPHGAVMHIIKATIGGDDLEPSSSLTITYGDKTGGSPGAQAQFLARKLAFPVFIGTPRPDPKESLPDFTRAMQSVWRPTVAEVTAAATFAPSLKVVGGEPAKLFVSVPSITGQGTSVTAKLTAMDIHGNHSKGYNGKVFLSIQPADGVPNYAGAADLKDGRGKAEITLDNAGPVRISAVDPENSITGTSGPMLVSKEPPKEHIYWGEIHTHTIFSDALGQVEEHFNCAINNTHLDFGAISDHDIWLERATELWDKTIELTNKHNRPGEFVTLLGYEMMVQKDGRYSSHANIYFPGDSAPLVPRMEIKQIKELCESTGAIAIPHHTQYGWPNMGTNWDDWADFTPEEMPVVEMISTHGLSEYYGCPRSVRWPAKGQSVQDGLAKGHRFGFIGGSDYHECLLGHAMDIEKYPRTVNNRHMQTHTGLIAVYAPELTREAIFDAIKNRRVYATSGERMVVDFSINGTPMGGELKLSDNSEKPMAYVNITGAHKLRKVEIIRSGEVVYAVEPGSLRAEFTWKDESSITSGTYYYVRATQENNEQAWSSPVWVDLK